MRFPRCIVTLQSRPAQPTPVHSLPNLDARVASPLVLQEPDKAAMARDALVKIMYARLFDWIVVRVNQTTNVGDASNDRYIGLLDVYGFEFFDVNSFEQARSSLTLLASSPSSPPRHTLLDSSPPRLLSHLLASPYPLLPSLPLFRPAALHQLRQRDAAAVLPRLSLRLRSQHIQ